MKWIKPQPWACIYQESESRSSFCLTSSGFNNNDENAYSAHYPSRTFVHAWISLNQDISLGRLTMDKACFLTILACLTLKYLKTCTTSTSAVLFMTQAVLFFRKTVNNLIYTPTQRHLGNMRSWPISLTYRDFSLSYWTISFWQQCIVNLKRNFKKIAQLEQPVLLLRIIPIHPCF